MFQRLPPPTTLAKCCWSIIQTARFPRWAVPRHTAQETPQSSERIRQLYLQTMSSGRKCLPSSQALAGNRHPLREKHRVVPCRHAYPLHRSLGQHLVTTPSKAILCKNCIDTFVNFFKCVSRD